jgi:hypothetical protein
MGGREVKPGSGEEALDEARTVLHPFKPGLHQGSELVDVALARLARDLFRCDHTDSTGLSWGAGRPSASPGQLAAGTARPLRSQRLPAASGQRQRPAPAASARRHRFADIRLTRNRPAISRSLAPASINPAAASRTCPRRARSAASSPPPSGYLIPPAYRRTG